MRKEFSCHWELKSLRGSPVVLLGQLDSGPKSLLRLLRWRVSTVRRLACAAMMARSSISRSRIDWFSAVVPQGMQPDNQDGEVELFDQLAPDAVRQRVATGGFTLEAGLVLADFFGA